MASDALFHGLFWSLFAGPMVIRVLSVLQLRKAGEGFIPDAQAIKHEGRAPFAARVLVFFLLIGVLVAHAINPPWMRALDLPLPGSAHWVDFGLGLLGLATWVWAQATLGANGPRKSSCKENTCWSLAGRMRGCATPCTPP